MASSLSSDGQVQHGIHGRSMYCMLFYHLSQKVTEVWDFFSRHRIVRDAYPTASSLLVLSWAESLRDPRNHHPFQDGFSHEIQGPQWPCDGEHLVKHIWPHLVSLEVEEIVYRFGVYKLCVFDILCKLFHGNILNILKKCPIYIYISIYLYLYLYYILYILKCSIFYIYFAFLYIEILWSSDFSLLAHLIASKQNFTTSCHPRRPKGSSNRHTPGSPRPGAEHLKRPWWWRGLGKLKIC
jgi:hypothetical protein